MVHRSYERLFSGFSIVLSILALGFLVASCFRIPIDADSFFHLATARNWLEYGLSPFVDHLTFTHAGEAVRGQPIAFQVMLYGYVDALGVEAGFIAMKLTFMLLTFATVAWLAWRARAPWPLVAFSLALLAFSLQTRAQTRPELGIFWFTALAFWLYHRALEGETPGARAANMIPIVLLTAIWVGWYNAIFAYVIFFGLFVDLALRQWENKASVKEWIRWLAWGLLVFVLGWGPPDFSHDFFATLMFSGEWKQVIQEWEPPVRYWNLPGTWILALAAAAALALSIKHRSIGLLIVLIVFIQQTLQISRLLAPTGIVIACSLLYLASLRNKTQVDPGLSDGGLRRLSISTLVLTTLLVAASGYVTSTYLRSNEWRGAVWPERLTQYLRESHAPGRIYNQMERGGYLAWELGPAFRIYIDGRVHQLFSLQFFKNHLEVQGSRDALEAELKKHDVDYVVLDDDISSHPFMLEMDEWTLDFADLNDLLYVRDGGQFAVSGVLRQAPECWTPELATVLQEELLSAQTHLPDGSPFTSLIRLMANRGAQRPGSGPPLSGQEDRFADWRSVRFAAYQAFDEGKDDLVIFLLSDPRYRFFKDGLVLALAHLRSDRLENANEILLRLLSESWLEFEKADFAAISLLFSELEQRGALERFDAHEVREFLRREGHWPPQGSLRLFRTSDLCHRELAGQVDGDYSG